MMQFVGRLNGHNLYRGARPSTLEEFKALNCKTVINLETGAFEFLHGRNYEEDSWAEKCDDVILLHFSSSDFTPPARWQVDRFINFAISYLNYGDVYFHCLHGVDRTGYMAASYRILVQGWTPELAITEMLNMGFHRFPYYFWIDGLRKLKTKVEAHT